MDRIRLCGAKVGDVNDAFDRVLSGFAPAGDRPAAGSAPISAERPPKPRESRQPRARPAADRTGPSHFHDVDSREDVDDLRPGGDSTLSQVEILVSYNFHSGWCVQFDPTNSHDWTADSRNAWTVPVGLDVGKVWSLGQRSISAQLGVDKLVERPAGAPD